MFLLLDHNILAMIKIVLLWLDNNFTGLSMYKVLSQTRKVESGATFKVADKFLQLGLQGICILQTFKSFKKVTLLSLIQIFF